MSRHDPIDVEEWATKWRQRGWSGFDPDAQAYTTAKWAALEPEARRQWDEIQPGTWDEMRHAIRHAWERGRRRRAA